MMTDDELRQMFILRGLNPDNPDLMAYARAKRDAIQRRFDEAIIDMLIELPGEKT